MVRIIADSSTMYSSEQARGAGFEVAPLSVTINETSYKELDNISSEEFVALVRQGHMPSSSQPSIGDVMELYQQHPEEEIINISMADGLSGTYSSAVAAANLCEGNERITVINSRTLCGPHRYLAEAAAGMAKIGQTGQQIIEKLEKLMDTAKSFLIPCDFDYLRRGGRLSPLVSYVGKTIRLAPVLTQSADGRQLVMAGIKRSYKQAVAFISKQLSAHGVGEGWRIYITHADVPELAQKAKEMLQEMFPAAIYEIFPLTPVFITQGGPGCVAIQAIRSA